MKKLVFIFIAFSLFLAACDSPLLAPVGEAGGDAAANGEAGAYTQEDILATAVSMAGTMAAETQTAMPTLTFTPAPPTATFTPIFTETPLPTITPLFTNTPVPTATSEDEIKMLYTWEGQSTRILIVNQTKADATVSLYLNEGSNARGYYGYIPVPYLAKKQSVAVEAPMQGYYCIWAWMSDGDKNWSTTGCFGINNPDKHEARLNETGSVKWIGP